MRFALALVGLLAACASTPPPVERELPPPTTAGPTTGPSAQVVNATILTNGCQHLGKGNSMLAESAMYHLVEACTSVPGGSTQFVATLQPGGRIDITAAPGQPDVVPICILKHSLLHKVPLKTPCQLDVKIEQTSVAMPTRLDAGVGG
jgi:hypothetical protein